MNINCFGCQKPLPNVFGDFEHNQPDDGVEFIGRPCYGSRYDDVTGMTKLVINICDECLKTNADLVRRVVPRPAPASLYLQWTAGADLEDTD